MALSMTIWNGRLMLALQDGSLRTFTFAEASGKAFKGQPNPKNPNGEPPLHVELMKLAIGHPELLKQWVDIWHYNLDLNQLIGKTISILTGPDPRGIPYGSGNPRKWEVGLVDAGPFQLRDPLPDEYKQPKVYAMGPNGQTQQPMQQQGYGYQQQPPMQQGYGYQQPMSGQQVYAPQPVATPPMSPVGQTQQMQGMQPRGFGQPQPYSQPLASPTPSNMGYQPVSPTQPANPAAPAGMDPGVAAAMQAVNAQNVQEVPPTQPAPGPYDESIPF